MLIVQLNHRCGVKQSYRFAVSNSQANIVNTEQMISVKAGLSWNYPDKNYFTQFKLEFVIPQTDTGWEIPF